MSGLTRRAGLLGLAVKSLTRRTGLLGKSRLVSTIASPRNPECAVSAASEDQYYDQVAL